VGRSGESGWVRGWRIDAWGMCGEGNEEGSDRGGSRPLGGVDIMR